MCAAEEEVVPEATTKSIFDQGKDLFDNIFSEKNINQAKDQLKTIGGHFETLGKKTVDTIKSQFNKDAETDETTAAPA